MQATPVPGNAPTRRLSSFSGQVSAEGLLESILILTVSTAMRGARGTHTLTAVQEKEAWRILTSGLQTYFSLDGCHSP